MYKLVLIRHGESTWNLENRFTGWTDVDLTDTGVAAWKGFLRAHARLTRALDEEPEPLLALAQRRLVLALLGQVPRDLEEPENVPVGRTDGRQLRARPEARAVLPDAPALVHEPPLIASRVELEARLAAPHRLVCVKDGHVFSEDFAFREAGDPMSAPVPARDATRRIDQDDRGFFNGGEDVRENLRALAEILAALDERGILQGLSSRHRGDSTGTTGASPVAHSPAGRSRRSGRRRVEERRSSGKRVWVAWSPCLHQSDQNGGASAE